MYLLTRTGNYSKLKNNVKRLNNLEREANNPINSIKKNFRIIRIGHVFIEKVHLQKGKEKKSEIQSNFKR